MSDALIASLNARITALEADKQKLNNALRKERIGRKEERDDLAARLEALKAEHAELLDQVAEEIETWDAEKADLATQLEEAKGNPDERVSKLEAEIRKRDVLGKFEDVRKELGDGWTLEDLFKQFDFDPSSVEDAGKFDPAEAVRGWRDAKPGMFKAGQGGVTPPAPRGSAGASQGAARPPLVVGDSAGRGARDTASTSLRYTQGEVRQPGWMNTPRGRQILDARKAGTAEMVEGE
jgi:hypothetical protein